MKVLFLDDSFQSSHSFQGYGGFCIDSKAIRPLSDDLSAVKKQYQIPWDTELKWSPSKGHYLNSTFKGKRQSLYSDALSLLRKYNARLICVIHHLSQCYGVTGHGWSEQEAKLWAAKEQMKYLAERFQRTFLESQDTEGIIISDNYASKRGEQALIRQATTDLTTGTFFQTLDRVSMMPLMADSRYCFPIQLADLLTGITVAFFAESKYAKELFPGILDLFAYNPHPGAISFGSTYTAAVLGVGIKLFPPEFKKKGKALLKWVDADYLVTKGSGIRRRSDNTISDSDR